MEPEPILFPENADEIPTDNVDENPFDKIRDLNYTPVQSTF